MALARLGRYGLYPRRLVLFVRGVPRGRSGQLLHKRLDILHLARQWSSQ